MAVFDGVQYTLSPSLSPTRKHELSSLLDINGAVNYPPYTHLIALAASHAHNDIDQSDTSLKVVSDRWVDRSVVMGKIQPEQYYSPDPAMIFSGVVACATDLSAPDLEVLSAGITALGGQWRIGLTRDVTHLFALRPGSDKYNTALHFAPQTHMCILTPHWFDDSVRLGRRLMETPYAWPDPPVLRPGATLQIEDDPNVTDTRRRRKPGTEGDAGAEEGPSTSNEGEKVKVWDGRRILLSYTLELSKGSREAMEAGIRRAGGVVVGTPDDASDDAEESAVDECDVLITRWRSGKAYFKAARASLFIGTLNWLFSVESSGTLYSPLDSLLWYPTPKGGIPGLVDSEICLTNYTGAARDYLKRLISLMGAKFTPSMTIENKVLVAGFQPSPKSTRALAWSIPVVNHTWLEDCFVEWRALTVGLERYIVYPPGIDFGKMLMTRRSDSSPTTTSVLAPMVGGGAVPGGRGVGVIDVDDEEQRDADYRERKAPEEAVVTTHGGGGGAGRSRRRDEAPTRDNEKPSTTGPRARSRSRSRGESVLGAFVDHVVEIPDDDEDEEEEEDNELGGSRTKRAKPTSGTKMPLRSRGGSKLVSSVPRGTSASMRDAREVEEVVALDLDAEEEADEVDVQPLRGATSKSATKEKEKSTSTSKSKPAPDPDRPRSPLVGSTLHREKVNGVRRRGLATSMVQQSDMDMDMASEVEAEVQEVGPTKDRRGASTSKGKPSTALQKEKKTSAGPINSDSESPVSLRKGSGQSATPVKSGMKPKSRSKSRPKATATAKGKTTEGTPDEPENVNEDEDGRGPAPTKMSETRKGKGKGKAREEATTRNEDAVTTRDGERASKKAPPRSPTRSPSPTPNTTNARSPKRRLSVVIPPAPKDYYSQGSHREGASSPGGPKEKVARTSSIRAVAAEASTSVSKRAKPSPAVSAAKTKPGTTSTSKAKAKAKAVPPADLDSETEDEAETSMMVDSPMTSTSRGGPRRSAANKASTKLRDVIMPDVVSFEKERKNEKRRRSMGGESVVSTKEGEDEEERGAKRRKLDQDGSKDTKKGKTKEVAREEEEEEEEEEEAEVEDAVLAPKQKPKPTKGKAKASPESDEEPQERKGRGRVQGLQEKKTAPRKSEASRARTNIRLMTTGVSLDDDVVKRLTKLGVQMTTKPTDCTHLIAKGIVRTEKFLCAMSKSPHILTEEWANVSAKANKLLPESNYLLSDPAAEQKWGFKFAEAMERSKGPDGGPNLFKQMTFYVTPKVSVDTKLLKNVVLAGGGQVQTSNPTVRILKGKENRYVVSCPEDKSIWRPLAQEGYTIYSSELIVQAALKQKVEWKNKECIVTG